MNIAELKCPACGAPVKRKTERGQVFCEYCGTKIILDDIDYYKEDSKIEQKKLEQEIELEKLKNENAEKKRDSIAVLSVVIGVFVMFVLVLIAGVLGYLD